MNRHFDCEFVSLQNAISNSLSQHETSDLEAHLERCADCQAQLEELAADSGYWTKATQHLSRRPAASTTRNASDSVVVSLAQPAETETGENAAALKSTLLDAPAHPEMLGRIDNFEIEEEIGRGGCGVVYRGFDTRLNRPVAIKFLAPHLSASGVARKRFAREARAAAAVVHPHVVPIHNVSASIERPYIVMSLVDGKSLESHVKSKGTFGRKDSVRIAKQIAGGLSAAHRQGLIHRDIKPANILLEQDVSRVMITDFGLARAADDMALTQTGWLAGTPHYMSPEQAKGLSIDHRSDLFSLGSVLYFIATGREPFRAEKPFAVMQGIITKAHLPACSVDPDVSQTLSQIIDKLLEKDPRDRFQTADEVHDTLEKYLAYLHSPHNAPRIGRIRTKRQRLRRRTALLGSIGLIVVATIGWLFLTNWKSPNVKPNQAIQAGNTEHGLPETTIESAASSQSKSISLEDVKTFDQIQLELGEIDAQLLELENEIQLFE